MRRKNGSFSLFYIILSVALGTAVSIHAQNSNQELCGAAADGNLAKVNTLLAKGADVNARDTFGDTALMEAVLAEKPDILKLLLAKGADVNAKNNDGGAALSLAKDMGKVEFEKLLKAAGAKEEVPQ